jgi:hypothetical protein
MPWDNREQELLPEALSSDSQRRLEARSERQRRQFLKGPIPLVWLERAARLQGKAFTLSVLLWFMTGVNGPGPFRLSRRLLERFQIGRKASYRALTALEAEGLIVSDRNKGRLPRIRIIYQSQPDLRARQ